MTNRNIPSTFVKNALQNGVGRYVCQLQRITLSFCKSRGGSRGMRDFIENHLLEFTRNNPGVVVYLKPRRHRSARIVGNYLNGNADTINVEKASAEEICKWVEFMRTRSGVKVVRLRKTWHTETPSIQGIWDPALNKDSELNVTEFPSEKLSRFIPTELSTSEKIIKMAEQMKNLHVSESKHEMSLIRLQGGEYVQEDNE